MQIIYVQWRDAFLNEGWHNEADIERIKTDQVWIVESIGWLVDQNDDHLIICGSTSNTGAYSEILKIPIEAIVDIQILANLGKPTTDQQYIDPTLPTLQYQQTFYMDAMTNDRSTTR